MRTLVCILLLFYFCNVFGQKEVKIPSYWSLLSNEKINPDEDNSKKYFQLDFKSLNKLIEKVPTTGIIKSNHTKTFISFPLPNGQFQEFLIEQASNFHSDLAAKYPMIKAFKGRSIEDPTKTIRFSYSPNGISAMIQSGTKPLVFIDQPLGKSNQLYQVYYKEKKETTPYSCEVYEIANRLKPDPTVGRNQGPDCQLRTFRLALACTGEYAEYHGGNISDVLSAMNATMTIINAIFERDLAIHLELISASTQLIYFDKDTDPYSNEELADMLGENQIECDTKIGTANYDIGHVFGTGIGGVAFLGVVCEPNYKGSGATGFTQPEGPTFAIDLVAHEMAHQFGAQHTFNGDQVACAGSNRSEETSVEPGSGSTIMSYAGICPPQNIQNNSDGYFHAISLQQIRNVLNSGGNCGIFSEDFNNNSPISSSSTNIYFIPKSTPFALTIAASDSDNNGLTYTWEQMDKEIAPQPPQTTNSVGPLFRSLPPNGAPTRYFPNLNDLVNNNNPRWEVLPSVAREINFRGTIRDNYVGGGCTDELDIQVVVEDVLPFEVLSPNENLIWEAGTQQVVSWVVGSTNKTPINTEKVTVLLSLDGGFTYPIILAEEVSNTGNTTVLVPNSVTNSARIMVKAVGNIFFDISNKNFEITKPTNDFEINVNSNQLVCVPELAVFEIQIGETGNFTELVNLSLEGLPAGIRSTFSNENTMAPSTVNLNLTNFSGNSGLIEFSLIAKSSSSEKTRTLSVFVANELPTKTNLLTPFTNAGSVLLSPTLEWTEIAEVTTYQVDLSTSSDFSTTDFLSYFVNNTTFKVPNNLNNATKYYWRVSGENACGNGPYSDISTFETINEICSEYSANDLPKNIPSLFRSTIPSEIIIPEKGKLLDVNIKNLTISHSFIGDINIELESPNGTIVRLVEQICNANRDLNLSFDTESLRAYEDIPCPPSVDNFYQPLEDLAAFIGEEIEGKWELRVIDNELIDGGALENWELEICYQKEKPLSLISNKRAVSCFGDQDGTLSVIPEGGTGNYQYIWTTGETTATITGLNAGIYSVTISDGESSMDSTFLIEEPSIINSTINIDQAGCIGANNGRISTLIDGGTAPYNFQWSNGAVTTDLFNLNSGKYQLTVTDRLGCEQFDSVDLVVYPLVEFAISNQINPSCPSDSTGAISMENGLTNNLIFNWSNGLLGATQNDLPIGNYTVTATDDNGCFDTKEVMIIQEKDTIKPVLLLTNPIVYLDENGQANLNISSFDNGSFDNCGGVNLQASRTNFTCQSIGMQSLFIEGSDDSGNSTLKELTIQIIDTIVPTFECLEEIFIDGCQALTEEKYPKAVDNCSEVKVSILQFGQGGYSNNPDILSFQAIDENENVSYCYVPFRRENNLSTSVQFSDPLCTGENNGSASIQVMNGQAPYTYQWNDPNNQTESTANQLFSGVYEVTVTDNTGCQFVEEIALKEPFPIGLLDTELQDEINGTANGSILINPLGGTGDLAISWFKGDTLIGEELEIKNLAAGDYKVFITDVNNCFYSKDFTIGLLTNTVNFSFVENIDLYPNPTSGLITLAVDLSTPKLFTIAIYNLLGAEVILPISSAFEKERYQFDLSAFENGVYFVKLNFEDGVVTKPLVLLK